VEQADIDTFVYTEDNRIQTALETVWCSAKFDYGVCMNSLGLVDYEH